ncbi:MAG: flagellar FliJ family protein [Chthonomonadaceae bacterium]|nr:flagellar FliJ family protein [Chthonomonadaceae bacterium]
MAKFKFKLQKFLEYREWQVDRAKHEFSQAMARQLEVVHEIGQHALRFERALQGQPSDVPNRLALETYLGRLSEERRDMDTLLGILTDETNAAKERWLLAKRDFQAVEKLRDGARDEWELDQVRREQAELDEWAVTRRAA